MALGLACVLGSGLFSYATVLNPHVPAATLVLASAACVAQLARSENPGRAGGWLVLAGLYAALAVTFDPAAVLLAALMIPVILAVHIRPSLRVGGVLLFDARRDPNRWRATNVERWRHASLWTVAVTAAEQVERLRSWASGRCLAARCSNRARRRGLRKSARRHPSVRILRARR